MNPFLWRGPEFLLFYVLFAIAMLLWQAIRGSMRQSAAAAAKARTGSRDLNLQLNVGDPIEVAYLRAGQQEAICVAVMRLMEEGCLEQSANGMIVQTPGGPPASRTLTPVERTIYDSCRSGRKITDLFGGDTLRESFAAYRKKLEGNGLLIGPEERAARRSDVLLFSAALILVAMIKVAIALDQGRRNIWFLIILSVAAVLISIVAGASGRITEYGKQTLANLRKLAQPAQAASFNVSGGQFAMAAALFGIAALPLVGGEQYRRLYPAQSGDGSSSYVDTSSSSSGCGSGGGDGGGGGSGCGGCGGGGD